MLLALTVVLHMKNNSASSVTARRMIKVDRCIHFSIYIVTNSSFRACTNSIEQRLTNTRGLVTQ